MFSSVCCGQCLFDINYNVCTLGPHSAQRIVAVIILCFGLELESDSSDTMCASVWSVLW